MGAIMLLRTEEGGGRVEELEIAKLERAMKVRFPKSYRNFLLTHNGGRPIPAGFELDLDGDRQRWQVHFFFSVNDSVKSCRLDWNEEVTRETRPPGVLPIAHDDFGNTFYLRTTEGMADSVYFGPTPWNWQKTKLTKVADTFSDFLQMLS
jgi:hypothetical protein